MRDCIDLLLPLYMNCSNKSHSALGIITILFPISWLFIEVHPDIIMAVVGGILVNSFPNSSSLCSVLDQKGTGMMGTGIKFDVQVHFAVVGVMVEHCLYGSMVECLPSMCKALCSISDTRTNK